MAPQVPAPASQEEIKQPPGGTIVVDAKPAGAVSLPVGVEASEQNPEEQSKIVGETVIMASDVPATDEAPLDVVQQEKP